MKILVTGGAGFIGSHTVVELYKAGFEVVVIDNFSNSTIDVIAGIEKILNVPIKYFSVDCNDSGILEKIIEYEKIEGIIHFAAFKSVNESINEPLKYYNNNINSTINVLNAMKKTGVKNLVFSSSCTVYGQPEDVPVTELTSRKQATSPYGNTKSICEDIISDTVESRPGIKAVALRYFNPVGAHESGFIGELPLGIPNNLVPYITQVASGKLDKLTIFGGDYNTIDGTCIRDFIHVVDLAKSHVASIKYLNELSNSNFYDVFNIGTGKGYTVLELINRFEKVNKIKLNYLIGDRREGDTEQIYGCVTKAKDILDWKAELTIDDMLRDAWNWQKKYCLK
ncbi:MAG: UDP-glucose 4-epimerase GalE [Bacteroidota bacterium]